MAAVRDMAQRLGVRSPTLNVPAADLGGSLTLGSHEVSPLDMATAYGTIAAHGLRCYPKPVLALTGSEGKPVEYAGPPKCQQVLSPAISDTITNLLQGVIISGTGTNNGQIGRPAAGKTGTTDNHYDAWFDGYIPQLVTAVWVGDSRSPTQYPLQQCYTPGCPTADGVSGVPNWYPGTPVFGGDLPTKIWAATMIAAAANLPVVQFPPPDQQIETGISALVPNVAGMDLISATNTLAAAGFTPSDGGGIASAYPPGAVAYTSPAGGSQAPQGSAVTIYTSTGLPPPPPVPTTPPKKPAAKTPITKPTVKGPAGKSVVPKH